MLADLLRFLGIQEETIQVDVEGIEHHVSPQTLSRLTDLVAFFESYPDYLSAFASFRTERDKAAAPEPRAE